MGFSDNFDVRKPEQSMYAGAVQIAEVLVVFGCIGFALAMLLFLGSLFVIVVDAADAGSNHAATVRAFSAWTLLLLGASALLWSAFLLGCAHLLTMVRGIVVAQLFNVPKLEMPRAPVPLTPEQVQELHRRRDQQLEQERAEAGKKEREARERKRVEQQQADRKRQERERSEREQAKRRRKMQCSHCASILEWPKDALPDVGTVTRCPKCGVDLIVEE